MKINYFITCYRGYHLNYNVMYHHYATVNNFCEGESIDYEFADATKIKNDYFNSDYKELMKYKKKYVDISR